MSVFRWLIIVSLACSLTLTTGCTDDGGGGESDEGDASDTMDTADDDTLDAGDDVDDAHHQNEDIEEVAQEDDRPLGDSCWDPIQCASDHCFDGSVSRCSECTDDSDCASGATCDLVGDLGFAICIGDAALGDSCSADDDCASGRCNDGSCSECTDGTLCESGECIEDTTAGYFVCAGAVGDECAESADCASDKCFSPDTGASVCSECESTDECGTSQECAIAEDADYAACIGTVALGESCTADTECVSGACNSEVCSECTSDEDCSGECIDDAANSGYYICTRDMGETCVDSSQCMEKCYIPDGDAEGGCGMCATDDDCGAGESCLFNAEPNASRCG